MNTSIDNNKQFYFNCLKNEDFIQYALINVGTIWLRYLYNFEDLLTVFTISNTNTREVVINDMLTWKNFSHSCFVPHYTPNEWTRGIYKLTDFLLLTSTINDPKFNHLDSEDNIKIVTAYHSSIGKRVIMDGFHRAVALEIEMRDSRRDNIANVTVWECYGGLVHTIFPFEFSHLLTSCIKSKESGNYG